MFRFFILIACTVASLVTHAQSAFTGKIVDAQSNQPLESATITRLGDTRLTVQSDHYGLFTIPREGRDSFQISFIGYQAKMVSGNTSDARIIIELEPAAVQMKDVVVLSNNLVAKFSTLAKIDLDLKPVRNTQELMRLVPGLFIAQHAGGGKAEQIFLRGFDCDHGTDIQVGVDGIPVNMVSHAHGQGYADAHFIIPETINNIDFGAGPYYAQHGDLNTAGYINFSTFTNISNSKIQVEAGRFNTFRTLGMFDLLKKNKEKQSAYVAADYYYTDGPTDNKQKFNRINLFGKYNLALSANTQLTATLSHFSSHWDASGQIPTRAVEDGLIDRFGSIDPSEGGNTSRQNLNVQLAHHFSNGSVWENQVWYSHYVFNLYSNFTFYLNDPVNGDEINQAESRNLGGFLSKYSHSAQIGNWSLNSIYGVGLRYDATDSSKLAHVVKREFLSYTQLGKIKEGNTFGYFEEQASIGRWLFDAGVRFDYLHFDYQDELNPSKPAQGKSTVSPKLSVQYTVNPHLQFYAKAGKGFHSNDARVVVEQAGYQILPAAYGTDLGMIYKPNDHLMINVAAWWLYLEQEFVYVGDDGNLEPSGKTKRLGLDLIARYQFNQHLFANLNVNLTRARALNEPKSADFIPLAPVATSTGGLFYRSRQGWNGGLSYRYISDRPANEDNSIRAKGYFVADASVNYSWSKIEIGLAVENLFNTEWNEAQFATESRLKNEPAPVSELNFTPGTPFFARIKLAVSF